MTCRLNIDGEIAEIVNRPMLLVTNSLVSKAGRLIAVRREDFWARSWRGTGAHELETTLETVARSLAERGEALAAMRADGLRIDLMLGLVSGHDNFGLFLPARTLALLAGLDIDVHLDAYFTPTE